MAPPTLDLGITHQCPVPTPETQGLYNMMRDAEKCEKMRRQEELKQLRQREREHLRLQETLEQLRQQREWDKLLQQLEYDQLWLQGEWNKFWLQRGWDQSRFEQLWQLEQRSWLRLHDGLASGFPQPASPSQATTASGTPPWASTTYSVTQAKVSLAVDGHGSPPKRQRLGRHGRLSDAIRLRASLTRKLRACDSCRGRKVKVG